jgi:hypothetical protein
METLSIKRYFDWNDALRRFFLRDSEASVKLLCVDEAILDTIGEKYGIEKSEDVSFADDFKKSVALSNKDRLEMIAFWQNDMRCHVPTGGNSLFQCARRLSMIEVPTWVPERFELPSLALTVLFVLLCANDRQPKASVINALSDLTGNPKSDEEGGFDYIPNLLSAICDYDPAFDNNRRGARKNVGCLQYQKVLNQREIALFKRFLYYNHIILDESLSSYEDLMNYNILRKLQGEFEPLRQRIVQRNKFVHEDYFKRQIQLFDKYRYLAEQANAATTPKILGTLYMVIGFSSAQEVTYDVYIDIPVDTVVRTTRGNIPVPLEESYNGLYPTNISIDTLDSYCGISCEDEHYEIALGQSTSGPLFFRESDNHLVQSQAPEPAHSYYVVIKHQNRRAITALHVQQSVEDVDFGGVFGEGWDSFYVGSWRWNGVQAVVRSEESIKAGPGISVPGERDSFFDKGLPYIVVPENHNCNNITVELDIVGNGRRTLQRRWQNQSGRIYIDLTLPQNHPHLLDGLPIIVKDGREAIDAYKVVSPQIEQDPLSSYDHLFIYDGWGRICLNRETPRLADNLLVDASINTYDTNNTEPLHTLQTWEDRSLRFIELLRASFLKSGFLLRKDINEIVSYLAGYYDFPQIENKGEEYDCLIKALVDLGFLDESYNEKGNRIYQLASPRLFPMATDRYRIPRFVLYGSYIRTQITSICNITPNYCFIKPYSEGDVNEHPYLAFIPLFMITSLNQDQIEYVKTLRISVEENTLSDRILSLVKSPQEFPADFMTKDNRMFNDSYNDGVSYPRVVYSFGRWRLEDGYNLYESYKPDNQTYRRVPIPNALMRQYYRSLSNSPVCLYDEGRHIVAFLNEMPIPRLFKKCLAYINLGLPDKKILFGLDGVLGENLINKVSEYRVQGEDQMIFAQKLSGSNTPQMIRFNLFGGRRFLMYYIKSSRSTQIYEPFQVHLYFAFNRMRPHAFAKKTGNTYSVFLFVDNKYYQLKYPSAVLAFSAIIREASDLNNHVDRSIEAIGGPLMEEDIIRKEITIVE